MEKLVKKVPAFKESRLPSLYSDFTDLREINPEGYAANIDAWASLLLEGLKSHFFKSSVSIASSGLESELALPGRGEPKSLPLILEEAIKSGKYIPLSLFKDTSPYASHSIADYISPMKWLSATWASMKLSSFKTTTKSGHLMPDAYIHIDHLAAVGKEIASQVQTKIEREGTYSSRLHDGETFSALVREVHDFISDSDMHVLLTHMSRDLKKMTLVKQSKISDDIYIKFGSGDAVITEDDIDIIKLKSSIRNLNQRTALLEHRLDVEIPERLQKLLKLKDGSRQERLKNALVQKAQVKKSLYKSQRVSNQLNSVLEAINEAHSNASLFETLKSTKSVLQSMNSKISFDEVDDLQVELDEEIASTSAISDSMIVSREGLDEEEIDKELEEIEKEELKKKTDSRIPSGHVSETPEELQKKLQDLKIEDTSLPGEKKEEQLEPREAELVHS